MVRVARQGSRWTADRPGIRAAYDRYMRSDEWRTRRRVWFEEEAVRTGEAAVCAVCGAGSGLELHHHDYDRMGSELHTDLVALCKADHAALHLIWDSSRQWRSMARGAGSRALVSVLAKNRHQRPRRGGQSGG